MLILRNKSKPGNSVNSYPIPQQNRLFVDDNSNIKDHSKEVEEIAANRLIERNNRIVSEMGEDCYFYRKKTTGFRCSCFVGFNSPDSQCPVCFKTGIVGGYDKYGTFSNIFSATSQSSLIGVKLSHNLQLRPLNFILEDNVKMGEIYFNFDILQTNMRKIDITQFLYSGTNKNAQVKLYVKTPSESSYVEYSNTIIESKLSEDILNFKIVISRSHEDVESPKISHFLLRYLLLDSVVVPVDIGQPTESEALDELGYYRNMETVNAFFDNRVASISSNDFIYRVRRAEFWKPITVHKVESVGIVTSFDCSLRLIQNFESYSRFPI